MKHTSLTVLQDMTKTAAVAGGGRDGGGNCKGECLQNRQCIPGG